MNFLAAAENMTPGEWAGLVAAIVAGVSIGIERLRSYRRSVQRDLQAQKEEIRKERDEINDRQDEAHRHEIADLKKTISDAGAFRDAYNAMVVQNDSLVRQNFLLNTEIGELSRLKEENAKLQKQIRELMAVIEDLNRQIAELKRRPS